MRTARFWIAALISCCALPARAQSQEDLQRQLEQLKKQYEETAQELQRRMAELEQQIEKAKEAKEAKEAKDKTVLDLVVVNVGVQFQGELASAPTYDLLREAETKIEGLEAEVKSFEFHGYFRSGYGLNGAGSQQVAFQAPGAGAKFRLGNETETYGEAILVNNWLNPERNSDKAWFKTELMVEANTTNSASYASFSNPAYNDYFRLREAFVRAGNIFASQPDLKLWAGERYYRRQHIEINDFYPLDMSGYGGGFEDLDVRIGKVSLGFLAGARPDIATENGTYAKSNFDLRLYDVKAPGGTLAFWVDVATAKGGTTGTGETIPTSTGYAIGVRHQRLGWLGGYHAFGIQYGKGAASNFSTSIDDPTPRLDSAERLLITEHLLIQPNDRFAVMPIFVYQRKRDGDPRHGWDEWISVGARPELFFTKYLSLAVEAGFDHTKSGTGQYEGWLQKLTVAPQLGAGRKFFSRPVLRVFATYAHWSDGLRGYVGGVPYASKTDGFTYGIQAETWW